MAQPRVAGMDAETFDQAVRRAKAYLQDGADCIHPIVLDDLGTLKRLPEAVPAPIICRITLRGTHLRPGPRLRRAIPACSSSRSVARHVGARS